MAKKIFINPGHSINVDCGAVNREYDVTEADIVYDVGCMAKDYLQMAGCSTKLLQSDNLCGEDGYKYEYSVCGQANLWIADLFVSIHCNSASPSAKGTECLVYSFGGEAEKLARCIQAQLVDNLGTVDRPIKERPDLAVLRETHMPAVLVEIAFISNEDDVQILMDKQDEIAAAIARGVTDYLQKE